MVNMSLELAGVDPADIDKYRADYAAWALRVRKRFARLPFLWNLKRRWWHFLIEVDNLGALPAEHLLIEIRLHDGIRACLAVGEYDRPDPYLLAQKISDIAQISAPPEVPRPLSAMQRAFRGHSTTGYMDSLFPRASDLTDLIARAPVGRDRHALRIREDEDKPLTSWSLDCEEFRHGRGPRAIGCWLVVPQDAELKRSHIHLRASAKNMASSVEMVVPIEIESTHCESFALASRWTVVDGKAHTALEADEAIDTEDE